METFKHYMERYVGKVCNVELTGWNDGVYQGCIVGEDKDFVYYKKQVMAKSISGIIGKKHVTKFGIIGKKYIRKVEIVDFAKNFQDDRDKIDRSYFLGKDVMIQIALKEGLLTGFFDFRNDDYINVSIHTFSEFQIILEYGKEVNISDIARIEEL